MSGPGTLLIYERVQIPLYMKKAAHPDGCAAFFGGERGI
jgi:hypothetical protein